MIIRCYFCNKEFEGTNGFCAYCDDAYLGISHVYTCYTNNILDFAAFTHGNKYCTYRIYINLIKSETTITASGREGWQTILTIPGEPINFKNVKEKLHTYLTFS